MPNNETLTFNDFAKIADGYINHVKEHLIDEKDSVPPKDKPLRQQFTELEKHYPRYPFGQDNVLGWNVDKIKILFELLNLKGREGADKILSFMEHLRFGWGENEYRFNNRCFDSTRHTNEQCRRLWVIKNLKPVGTGDSVVEIFDTVEKIFIGDGDTTDEWRKMANITLYLFSYCIAALYSSKLNYERYRIPFFLQIACERNSRLYKWIHEIVEICDVNFGLTEHCNRKFRTRFCGYTHKTVYPSQSAEKDTASLSEHRDIPVVVDGFENEKYYRAVLRGVANMPNDSRILTTKDKFNVLPIFVCSEIASSFNNIFSMDLTELTVSDEYFSLVKKHKQHLASWVLELVNYYDEYFFPVATKEEMIRHSYEKAPFVKTISENVTRIRTAYRDNMGITQKDATNIGILTFFFEKYLRVLRSERVIRTRFTTDAEKKEKALTQYILDGIDSIVADAEKSLVALHSSYSPTVLEVLSVEILDEKSKDAKRKERKAEKYAKNIMKHYLSFGVTIIITKAEIKDERYIFYVKPKQNATADRITRCADDVRRLLEKIEFFMPVVEATSIKIIMSEKPIMENSLMRILQNTQFNDPKIKIPYAMGYDIAGDIFVADVSKFPHLLIGGTSGGGKSTALHSLLMSIVYKYQHNPMDLRLLVLDFGSSELEPFNNVPQLIYPIITDIWIGIEALRQLKDEMERRIQLFVSDKAAFDEQPPIVCIIDEFAAFIGNVTAGRGNKRNYEVLQDILQRGRKNKIHVVLAAQDPLKEDIKISTANIAARMAFKCASKNNSRVIIGSSDAESLAGLGSLYFKSAQHTGLKYVQGSYMDKDEIAETLRKMDLASGDFESEFTLKHIGTSDTSAILEADYIEHSAQDEMTDEQLLVEIIMMAFRHGEISINQIQSEYEMGYSRAVKFVIKMERLGLITAKKGKSKRPRAVIPTSVESITSQELVKLLMDKYSLQDITDALTEGLNKQYSND